MWKLLNTTPGTSLSYDIARRPLKTSKIVGSDEKIQRRIDHFEGFYRLLSTRKSLYKKKTFSRKNHQKEKIIMSPLSVFSPEQIEISRKRPRFEKKRDFLDSRRTCTPGEHFSISDVFPECITVNIDHSKMNAQTYWLRPRRGSI